MLVLQKTTNTDPHFLMLIAALDADLKITDGEDHHFYHQYNGVEQIKHIVIGYNNSDPVCCGAFKELDAKTVELKRMYTAPIARKKGFAKQILTALEQWASSLGYKNMVLETGENQIAAVQMYSHYGYLRIPNYGQYKGVAASLCFGKSLFL